MQWQAVAVDVDREGHRRCFSPTGDPRHCCDCQHQEPRRSVQHAYEKASDTPAAVWILNTVMAIPDRSRPSGPGTPVTHHVAPPWPYQPTTSSLGRLTYLTNQRNNEGSQSPVGVPFMASYSVASYSVALLRRALAQCAVVPDPERQTMPATTDASTQSIEQAVTFRARPQDLYEVLTSQKMIEGLTRSRTILEPKAGGAFSYYDGQITGTFLELTPNESLKFLWRMKEWEDDVLSTVDIQLKSDEYGVTTLHLKQTGIPQGDRYGHHSIASKVSEGWAQHFWDRIKTFCGFEYRG
ncbi:unnamed protein product (mitochondrion) [Plasmodiophora brassicae]|uniref:Activator of Hsp90 ATPase homologue 1/2-like C-terminal domain-containing protein n=2 Tax=Plasmodiophora brassicae TaxID=37360 RepID=A0A3P3XZ06_PLABS|nr:unnamed protein product [Plasmodiophora brassicae]